MNEKEYLFNPFEIKKKTDVDLKNMYQQVHEQLLDECNPLYEYAHNIEVFSNLNYLVGEVIARLTKE